MEQEWRKWFYGGLRAFSGRFYKNFHCEKGSQFIQTGINLSWPRPPCCVKDKTLFFLQPPLKLTVDFLILKRPSQQKQKHHFNKSLSEVVFTLGLTSDTPFPPHRRVYFLLIPPSILFPSFPPSCSNECQTSNVSYLEAGTHVESWLCLLWIKISRSLKRHLARTQSQWLAATR